MTQHLHKQFTNDEVKEILEKYKNKTLAINEVITFLKIKRSRFFKLFKLYCVDSEHFSIDFKREKSPHCINPKAEKKIMSELKKEAELIADKRNPVHFFNYSYLKEILEKQHGVLVSVPTIISRAKKMGFIKNAKSKKYMIEKC